MQNNIAVISSAVVIADGTNRKIKYHFKIVSLSPFSVIDWRDSRGRQT